MTDSIALNNQSWDIDAITTEVLEFIKNAWDGLVDFAGDSIEELKEAGKKLFEDVGMEVLKEFVKHAFHTISNFISNPSGGLSLITQSLSSFAHDTIRQLTNPFASQGNATAVAAFLFSILSMGVSFISTMLGGPAIDLTFLSA